MAQPLVHYQLEKHQLMDRLIPEHEQRKARRKSFVGFLLIPAIIIGGFLFFRSSLKQEIQTSEYIIGTVQRGDIRNTFTASGTITPAYQQILNSPIKADIKSLKQKKGSSVKAGDVILELDESYLRLEYEKLKDELSLRQNNVSRLNLDYSKNLNELELDDQILGLRVKSMSAELRDAKSLLQIGGTTKEEVEKAQLELEILELEKQKLENELSFRKRSIEKDRLNLELEVGIQNKRLLELEKKLRQTKLQAPTDGVITWLNETIGQKVEEGEQLVRLSKLNDYVVKSSCSDIHLNKIFIGQDVIVDINNQKHNGKISSIEPAVEKNTIKFEVEFLDEMKDGLKPNMRVDVLVVTDEKEDILKIKNGNAFKGSKTQKVFVLEGDQAVRRELAIGLSNAEFVELKGNIRAGDKIILSDMEDYERFESIDLNQSN